MLDPVRCRLTRGRRSGVLASFVSVLVILALAAASATAVVVQLAGTAERLPTVLRLAARDSAQGQPG